MRTKSFIIFSIIILLFLSGCVGDDSSAANATRTVKTPVSKTANNSSLNINDTTPPGTVSYISSMSDTKWINWTWSNPIDTDFNYNNIYIDGKFKKNQSQNYYNLTGLPAAKTYTISIRTVDMKKNMNTQWVNSTTSTKSVFKDAYPPGPVDNLEASVDKTSINWTWDNPIDNDFSSTSIYIDGKFKISLAKPKNYYLLTGLSQNTQRTISIRTLDTSKNENLFWTNNTATTDVDNTPPGPVSGLTATLGTTRIDWRWTNPSDDDFSYVMVYLNGVFKTKTTQDYYNTTGLRTNTSYELSLVTSDTSNNIGTNWVNRTETTLE